jgi:hemolysin III
MPIMMQHIFKEPFSGLTHLGAAACAFFASIPLLLLPALRAGDGLRAAVFAVFSASLVLLYGASATYHLVRSGERGTVVLRRLDHMMIYVLIAGSYTPICLIALPGALGKSLFAAIWGLALLGMLLTLFFLNAPRWLTVANYILMGWLAMTAIAPLSRAIPAGGMAWLVLGGLFYSGGAVIYALKRPNPFPGRFGFHEIWHLFVIAGSLCHFCMMAGYIQYL